MAWCRWTSVIVGVHIPTTFEGQLLLILVPGGPAVHPNG
jgi:hypothetical protein